MSSIKELKKVYPVLCNLYNSFMVYAHWEWPLVGGHALSFPMDKSRWLPRVLLSHPSLL